MQVNVTFRHMDASDALRDYANKKVGNLGKYAHKPADAHVVMMATKHGHKVEMTVKLDGETMRGEEESDDMYKSVDLAVEKLERQLRKHKERLANH